VGSVLSNGTVSIEDFILNATIPSSNGTCPMGVCPESTLAEPCVNNVYNTTGQYVNGWTVLEFKRPINASDACDRDVADGAIIWAIGPGTAPYGLQMHSFRDNTNITTGTPFVWFRPLATTSPPVVGTTVAGQSTAPGSTNANSVPQTDAPVNQNSNPIPYNYGLPLYATILIIVGIFIVLVIILALIIGLIIRHRKRKNSDQGNFY